MARYIELDALVAEIERRIGEIDKYYCDINCVYQRIEECKGFISFIDTLEVKEVDLIKEVAKWKKDHQVYGMDETFCNIAKHFFELGMAVNNKAQKGV